MHEEKNLEHPHKTIVLVFISKSGNSPLENQYFSTFQIPLEPRCQNIDFH